MFPAGSILALLAGLAALAASGADVVPDASPAGLRQAYRGPVETWPAPSIDAGVAFVELAALPPTPTPTDRERAKAALGARLFADPRLSASGEVACTSCHDPGRGWSNGEPAARGHAGLRGRRNPPALFTAALRTRWGWDGRGISLASQSLVPLTEPDEMANSSLDAVLTRLESDPVYAAAFAGLHGPGPLSEAYLGEVLTAFQAGLEKPSRFDRFASGDRGEFTDQEILGLHLFRTKARCANCHFGPLLTDERFHNLKISFFGESAQDLGRYTVTGRPEDAGAFRTPSLRHIAKTAPYMHNGLFATLEAIINLYDRGGGEVWARNAQEAARPLYPFAAHPSPHLKPLGLTDEEKAALAAFLRTL